VQRVLQTMVFFFIVPSGFGCGPTDAKSPPPCRVPALAASNTDMVAEFSITHNDDAVLVPVRLRGKAYKFLVDTGSVSTIYDKSLKAMLGRPVGHRRLTTASRAIIVDLFASPDARLGDIPMRGAAQVTVIDLQPLRTGTGYPIYGIIGRDVLAHYVVRLDFDAGKLTLLRRDGAPLEGAMVLPLDTPTCSVRARLSGLRGSLTLKIDTGYNGSLLLRPESLKRLVASGAARQVDTVLAFDLGSRTHSTTDYRIAGMELGQFKHSGLIASPASYNVIGLEYLHRYVTTIDFPKGRLVLRKGCHFTDPDSYDHSGLTLFSLAGKITVEKVDAGSPAARADVQTQDVLVAVDDKLAREFSLYELRHLFRFPPREIKLRILRKGKPTSATLKFPMEKPEKLEKGKNETLSGCPTRLRVYGNNGKMTAQRPSD
jgi:hypothetical protein